MTLLSDIQIYKKAPAKQSLPRPKDIIEMRQKIFIKLYAIIYFYALLIANDIHFHAGNPFGAVPGYLQQCAEP